MSLMCEQEISSGLGLINKSDHLLVLGAKRRPFSVQPRVIRIFSSNTFKLEKNREQRVNKEDRNLNSSHLYCIYGLWLMGEISVLIHSAVATLFLVTPRNG